MSGYVALVIVGLTIGIPVWRLASAIEGLKDRHVHINWKTPILIRSEKHDETTPDCIDYPDPERR